MNNKEKEFNNTYDVLAICENCGRAKVLEIIKGKTVAEYFNEHTICEKCGCDIRPQTRRA